MQRNEKRDGELLFRQKQTTKINFLDPETTEWGGGSSTRRGGGRRVLALPPKFVFLWVWRGGTWDIPGILPGCPGPVGMFKKFVQDVRVHFSFPIIANYCSGLG